MASMSKAAQAKLAAEIQSNLPAPEWDSIPELKKWKDKITVKGKERNMTVDEMVVAYKDLTAEIEFRKVSLEAIKESLQAAFLLAQSDNPQLKKVTCEGYPVQLVTKSGSKRLVAEKLVEQGVTVAQIAAATVVSAGSQYILIGDEPKKK